MRYYTYDDTTKHLTAAPAAIVTPTRVFGAPTAAQYAALGAYPLAQENPEPPEIPSGKVAVPDGYELVNGAWQRAYRFEDAPPPVPRTFSKLKLYAALARAGLWDALREWLAAQTVEGINAYTAFSLAQELRDDHPMFSQWYAAAKAALGVDDATAEAVLEAAVEV